MPLNTTEYQGWVVKISLIGINHCLEILWRECYLQLVGIHIRSLSHAICRQQVLHLSRNNDWNWTLSNISTSHLAMKRRSRMQQWRCLGRVHPQKCSQAGMIDLPSQPSSFCEPPFQPLERFPYIHIHFGFTKAPRCIYGHFLDVKGLHLWNWSKSWITSGPRGCIASYIRGAH